MTEQPTVQVDGLAVVVPPWVAMVDSHLSACRSCAATIVWTRTLAGKRAPIDPDGTNHFATCPQADQWRHHTHPHSEPLPRPGGEP